MSAPIIAMLHYSGPPGIGGVEATIAAHARLFADDGWQVRIVAGSGAAPDPRIEIRTLPLLGSRHPVVERVQAELAGGTVSPDFELLVIELETLLAEALRDCAVAIIHNVPTLHKNLAFTAALARLHAAGRGPRLLAWAHDFAWRDPLYLAELHDGWPWSLLRTPWSDMQYVVVSQDRRALLSELLGLPEPLLAVVPPGVDVDRLH
jgi:hypothetical protein